jgi:hypothetical protein
MLKDHNYSYKSFSEIFIINKINYLPLINYSKY